MNKFILLFSVLTCLYCPTVKAQSTFESVYTLLQANCSASGCHGSTNPISFNVDASMTDVYNSLVGVTPTNPAAASKGDKLVDPGYPARSFLLRKMAHGLSSDLELNQPAEGNHMPDGQPKLNDEEIELVRQWILFGAPDTGVVVDVALISDFYNGMGLPQIQPPPAPDPSEGIQIHGGPYFIGPAEEYEYYHKYHMKLPGDMEVYKMDPKMHSYSHHFIVYEFTPTGYQNVQEGSRVFGNSINLDNFINSSFIGTWQYDRVTELPAGTGYFWDNDTRINLNYHIPNYSQDSILAAEVYMNIYYRPRQSTTVQMHAGLTTYGGFNPFILNVPNNATDTTFVNEQTDNDNWYIWLLQSHTHRLGKDYDIFLRNPDGSKGDQIFEGFFNQDYTFNQGFYDWEHPPVRVFEPQLQVDMNNGLIHEATYFNDGPTPIGFGFTSKDEMFITYFQYTTQLPGTNGISYNVAENDLLDVKVFPNPFNSNFSIVYNLEKESSVKIELFDMYGKQLFELENINQPTGKHTATYKPDYDLPAGIYWLSFTVNGRSITQKIISMN